MLLVETSLDLLFNCCSHPAERMKVRLKHLCLDTVVELAQQNVPLLFYICVELVYKFGAISRLSVSNEMIKTFASWLNSAYFDDGEMQYFFLLPEPSKARSPVNNLFTILSHVIHRGETSCTLSDALQPFSELLSKVISQEESDYDKSQITDVIKELSTHSCNNNCNTDWMSPLLAYG